MWAKRSAEERGTIEAIARFARSAALFAALLALAGVAVSLATPGQNSSIQLPADNPHAALQPGPGQEVTSRDCSLCHSTDYIVTQPRLDATHWDAEVQKMIKVFGAPITPSDAQTISGYLARNYGTESGESPKGAATQNK
jgi:sulfite dehydrogenase (cytochrome) subunit B